MNSYYNNNIHKIINNDITNNMINHCYFLHGADANQLKNYALMIAKSLLCEHSGQPHSPCNKCNACNKIDKNIHADVFIYSKGKFLVEDANAVTNESLIYPLEADYKIFILHEFEYATIPAQNKLLKTIEEPSSQVIFIITSASEKDVLPTIKSRAKQLFISSEGYSEFDLTEFAGHLFVNMLNSAEVLRFSNIVLTKDESLLYFAQGCTHLITSIVKYNRAKVLTNNPVLDDYVKILNESFTLNGLSQIMSATNLLVEHLKNNVNKNNALETFLFTILEVKHKCKK